MACFHPLKAWRCDGQIVFYDKCHMGDAFILSLPCGQCVGCRLEYSRQWAVRCYHEMQLHPWNCFITLTYSDDHLPPHGTLVLSDFQKFMKRLRWEYSNTKIRFFHCGEYGDKLGRPHYHAIIFGLDFPDKVLFQDKKNSTYTSESLTRLWVKGHALIGEANFETAAYVARYVLKKINGKQKKQHYERIDSTTGEIIDLKQEYTTMSRRPGIASDWYDKYNNDIYPSDNVVIKGFKQKPPRFYDSKYEVSDKMAYALMKKARQLRAKQVSLDNTPERLAVKKQVVTARLATYKRSLHED